MPSWARRGGRIPGEDRITDPNRGRIPQLPYPQLSDRIARTGPAGPLTSVPTGHCDGAGPVEHQAITADRDFSSFSIAVLHPMPYFVYRISDPLRLTHMDTKERYQDARALVRSLRETETQETGDQYRMVFAKHQSEAEKLLSTPRDERVIGED